MLMHKDVTTVHKDIVENILDKMAEDVEKEIDFNIMAEELSRWGWSKVDLPPFDNRYNINDILDWAYHHCQGGFETCGVRYIFEDQKDATLFALKWL